MIIALNGYSGSGKDLVGKMIQYYTSPCSKQEGRYRTFDQFVERGGGSDPRDFDHHYQTDWEIKKFAGKLKTIASMITGIPVEKFEDQEFKKTFLGPEWDYLGPSIDGGKNGISTADIVEKKTTVREFLQKLGTDGLRDGLHTNVWVNALFADYISYPKGKAHDLKDWSELYSHKACRNCGKSYSGYKRQYLCKECIENDTVQEYPNWIITDCRFENEAQAVKAHGGVVVRINRPGVDAVNAHSSETSLDNWNFDYTINNDGSIEDLLVKVATLVESVMVTI